MISATPRTPTTAKMGTMMAIFPPTDDVNGLLLAEDLLAPVHTPLSPHVEPGESWQSCGHSARRATFATFLRDTLSVKGDGDGPAVVMTPKYTPVFGNMGSS